MLEGQGLDEPLMTIPGGTAGTSGREPDRTATNSALNVT
ncbi:hypothetical protein BN874_830049 [Candidatus Contendobacter odensis Run_B_J11]|uniref:Uncharacterized protein n=1 Tax=Candidatus Contendobacter odensis Run_B_J11 TaxID=1400861 RepID=A0A7U7J6A5_9GAMM|nr:hypothetical protein BN874_830049 [Candidatus Contendobacter odensis Run_B_J11]